MIKKICAAICAVICVTGLCGCSLFGDDDTSANVYLPADPVKGKVSSSYSTTASGENGYGFTIDNTSTTTTYTISSDTTPITSTDDDTEPIDPVDYYYGKWYYNHISDIRQRIYARLYECAKNNEPSCDVSDLNVSDVDVYEAYWAFDYENPQFPALGNGYEIEYIDGRISNKVKTININYSRLASEVSADDLANAAEEIISDAEELETDYEKLKYIHDVIIDSTEYTKEGEPYISEADGPLLYGQALCEGYSKAFMYLAQSMGYPCICSVGVANMEDHMWNMVKIGNSWYNVDVTWDDPQTDDGTAQLRHDYFLICDAEIRLDHRVIRPVMLPTSPYGYFPHGYQDPDDVSATTSTSAASNNESE